MKRLSLIIFTASLFSSVASADSEHLDNLSVPASTDLTANHEPPFYFVSESDLPEVKQKALEGDAQSAERLQLYYALYKHDHAQGMYWLQIEAENGKPLAQLNLAVTLTYKLPVRSPEQLKYDHVRGCFWLRKALPNLVDNRDQDTANRLTKECNTSLHSE
jgi:hypothetical protein